MYGWPISETAPCRVKLKTAGLTTILDYFLNSFDELDIHAAPGDTVNHGSRMEFYTLWETARFEQNSILFSFQQ